jgi:hypothetical protein
MKLEEIRAEAEALLVGSEAHEPLKAMTQRLEEACDECE